MRELYSPGHDRYALAAACSIILFMFLVASTDAWAQVTQDYSLPSNEPRPISEFAESIPAENIDEQSPGFGTRILLLSHVSSLMLGLLAMAIAWLIVTGKCLIGHRRPSVRVPESWSIERRILALGVLLYAAGVLFGGAWSLLTWGSPWRWDPREVMGLFTLTISGLWLEMLGSCKTAKNFTQSNNTRIASLSTFAFGTVFLMVPIGSQFAAVQQASQQPHSFGGPVATLPILLTSIFAFFIVCLMIIWLSSLFAKDNESGPVFRGESGGWWVHEAPRPAPPAKSAATVIRLPLP